MRWVDKGGGWVGGWVSKYLGDEGAVAAVDHEDEGALPLGHLLGGGRGAHLGGVGVVKLLGNGPAVLEGVGGWVG